MDTHEPRDLSACLPPELAGATITTLGPRASRAAVYRVDAARGAFILKFSAIEDWAVRLRIQRLAADAGLAPRVVHVDEARRAVISELVEDRSLPAMYGNPATRSAALALLGQTLRRVHELPLPPELPVPEVRLSIRQLADSLAGFAVPAFVGDGLRRVIDEVPPSCDRIVLSHNDVNPGNLVYDCERLRLVDWDVTGPNDPYYDLAAIAVFLRIDDAGCRELLTSHGEPDELPARFLYDRRLVAALCGATFLQVARVAGHAGDAAAAPLPLGDFYQQMRAGLSLATAAGQWAFGLALITHGSTL